MSYSLKQFSLYLFIIFAFFSTEISHAGAPGEAKELTRQGLTKRRLLPRAKHTRPRKSIPGLRTESGLDSSGGSLPTSLTIDKDLKIEFPKIKTRTEEIEFLFQPYSQEFIYKNINLNHVSLSHLEPLLLRLEYRKSSFLKTLRLAIETAHYRQLMKHHPIFQLKESAIGVLTRFEEHLEDRILQKIQLQPVDRLSDLKSYLLRRSFEDIFGLSHLYSRILKHLEPEALGERDDLLDWFQVQAANATNKDALWTYLHFLDRNPEEIYGNLKKYLEVLIYENLKEVLQVGSKTYLQEAESLLESMKLLNPHGPLLRQTQLELEFSRLQFESYLEFPGIYNRLMEMYPDLDGAGEYFAQTPKKARVFFHFFDQLFNHGTEEFLRGQMECENPSKNRKACLLHWQEAVQFLKYVARNSPFTLHSRKAVGYLEIVQSHKKLEFPLVSKSELLRLMDLRQKPYP